MTLPIENRASTHIIGISVRTINRDGKSKLHITALWDRWFSEGLQALIPNKLDGDLYNIYTDYESDYLGYYTTVLGCKVSSLATIPEGMVGITLPAGEYQKYISKGELPTSVLLTWEQIWDSGLERAYQADFDVYPFGETNLEQMEVCTFVSI